MYLTKPDTARLLWPHLTGIHRTVVQKQRPQMPQMPVRDAMVGDYTGFNFIKKGGLQKAFKTIENFDEHWLQMGDKFRNKHFKGVKCEKWRKIRTERQMATFVTPSCSLLELDTQKQIYWLIINQLVPPVQRFGAGLEDQGQYLAKMDCNLVFKESKMRSFQWQKLYARKYLSRFGLIQEAKCIYCPEQSQSIGHLYNGCTRTQILFMNFERQYCVEIMLTECERLIGFDTTVKRDKIFHKRLGILRKNIYDSNHNDIVPRWDNMLQAIDRVYVLEYAIAERQGRVDKVLKEWDL
jgi:hypothetical protein